MLPALGKGLVTGLVGQSMAETGLFSLGMLKMTKKLYGYDSDLGHCSGQSVKL